MKKKREKKEYPEHFSLEIFEKFEKDAYESFAKTKQFNILNNFLLVVGTVIYFALCFLPWKDSLLALIGNFVDVSNDEIKSEVTLILTASTSLIAFVIWLLVSVIFAVVLKSVIKPEKVPDDIMGDIGKRVRVVMERIKKEKPIREVEGLLGKNVLDSIGSYASLAATLPLIAAFSYFVIMFVYNVVNVIKTDNVTLLYILDTDGYGFVFLDPFLETVIFLVAAFIPNLIIIRLINFINRKLLGDKWDYDLKYHIESKWWHEVDEERIKELLAEKEKAERVRSYFAREYLKDQKEAEEYKKSLEEWNKNHLWPTDFP